MNIFGKFISNFKEAYNEINAATLTGAIDAVVVRQKDGSYLSSPFHVRFGKIGVLRSREKVVDIEINGEPVDIHMKLGETGEAFFVEELEEGVEVSPFLGTSPLPHYLDDLAGAPAPDEDDARSQDSGVEAEELVHRRSKEEGDLPSKGIAGGRRSAGGKPQEGGVKEGAPLEWRQTVVANFSPCINVPGSQWRDELVRSKSLSSEFPLRRVSGSGLVDAFGSKTDVEDSTKSGRRRRKKRTNNKKQRSRVTESHSSDNSTTSETVDISSFSVTAPAPEEPMFIMDDVGHAHDIHRAALKGSANWPGNVSSSLGPDFHPFSDTDISPPPSPSGSRSGTPVKSDTEYECRKQKSDLGHSSGGSRDGKWSWTWGELPTPPVTPRPSVTSRSDIQGTEKGEQDRGKMAQVEDAHRSMLGGMFNFMRATRKARHNPAADGIYLDDLKLEELDPEVAALYFPRNSLLLEKQRYSGFQSMAKDEDVESGNGTSLPQSPHSVEGAIGGSKLIPLDSDFEEAASRHPFFDYRGYHDLSFSLCGALHEYLEGQFPEALFLQSLVTYDDFCENPDLIHSPNLVVRVGRNYMNWATAAPQIMALVLFQRPLPSKVVETVKEANMPKKEIRKRTESRGYSWFTWGRYQEQQQHQTTQQESAPPQGDQGTTTGDGGGALPSAVGNQEPPITLTSEATPLTSSGTTTSPTARDSTFSENPAGAKGSRKRNESSESEDPDEDLSRRRYRKTIRLSSQRIKKLNLRNGNNEVVFSVTTAYQGTTRCRCHIFLWNYDEKIVISDIDGTITKSDVLGHILPIIGKDWAQGGVAQLFTKIKNNGYNFLYLSARAIGQARTTRDYLRSIRQGDVSLPDGPLLLNPTSLIQAFHREVIEKKPEEFKISCLKDIRALFPCNENPFYAGYGNKINDVWAYSAVGIPIQRIFTINHRGELKHELTQTFQSTYSNLSDIAHHMFPPEQERRLHDEFSTMFFWRHPLPDYSSEIDAVLSQQAVK